MLVHPRHLRWPAVVFGIGSFAACGGETERPQVAPIIDAGADDRCPLATPAFVATPESGTLVMGTKQLVQGRVIAARPAQPERFENDWTVRFGDAAGAPLTELEITDACAFMPVHGHGVVAGGVRKLEPGTFALDGLNLFMRGPWEVQLAVITGGAVTAPSEATACDRARSKLGSDLVIFRACVTDD